MSYITEEDFKDRMDNIAYIMERFIENNQEEKVAIPQYVDEKDELRFEHKSVPANMFAIEMDKLCDVYAEVDLRNSIGMVCAVQRDITASKADMKNKPLIQSLKQEVDTIILMTKLIMVEYGKLKVQKPGKP